MSNLIRQNLRKPISAQKQLEMLKKIKGEIETFYLNQPLIWKFRDLLFYSFGEISELVQSVKVVYFFKASLWNEDLSEFLFMCSLRAAKVKTSTVFCAETVEREENQINDAISSSDVFHFRIWQMIHQSGRWQKASWSDGLWERDGSCAAFEVAGSAWDSSPLSDHCFSFNRPTFRPERGSSLSQHALGRDRVSTVWVMSHWLEETSGLFLKSS